MYGYIYETTNLINSKKYIGKHKSSNFDNKYLGSGIALTRAINKYGKENFSIKILEEVETNQDDLDLREMYYIEKYNAVKDNNYYNRSYGGENEGWNGVNKAIKERGLSKETRNKMSESQKKRFKDPKEVAKLHKPGYKHKEETKKKQSEAAKERWKDLEQKQKQSERFRGENNPMYGRSLLNNPAAVHCRFNHNGIVKEFNTIKEVYNYCKDLEYNLKYVTITCLAKSGKPFKSRYKRHEKANGLVIERI